MEFERPIVEKQIIKDLLYGDEDYLEEFVKVSIISFSEFKEKFEVNLSDRDLTALRTTGHKVKPVAQMMNLYGMLELYEQAKSIIEENKTENELIELQENMNTYCTLLLEELNEMVSS
jgi:hypothetical protein